MNQSESIEETIRSGEEIIKNLEKEIAARQKMIDKITKVNDVLRAGVEYNKKFISKPKVS